MTPFREADAVDDSIPIVFAYPGNACLPFHWIIEAYAKAYLENSEDYEWRKLDVRFREAEDEIAR
jgi:hypothetical protein